MTDLRDNGNIVPVSISEELVRWSGLEVLGALSALLDGFAKFNI